MTTSKPTNKLKFCGVSRTITHCPPNTCFASPAGECRKQAAALIAANKECLDKLLDDILRDTGPLTPLGVRKIAQERHGDVVALLLSIVAQQQQQEVQP